MGWEAHRAQGLTDGQHESRELVQKSGSHWSLGIPGTRRHHCRTPSTMPGLWSKSYAKWALRSPSVKTSRKEPWKKRYERLGSNCERGGLASFILPAMVSKSADTT